MPRGGVIAAARDRAEFPNEIDQLLLSVGANHAATAFRMARLVYDHRRAEEALRASERQLSKARDELERWLSGPPNCSAAKAIWPKRRG
jgi:hypothetical protein